MNLKTVFFAVPAALVGFLISNAAFAQMAPGGQWAMQRVRELQQKIRTMPLQVSCAQAVSARIWWGHHKVAFGLNPQSKSVVLAGWSELHDASGPAPGGGVRFDLKAQHDHAVMKNLAVSSANGTITAGYRYETSYERPCPRCSPDPGPTIHILNSLEFAAQIVPGTKILKVSRLAVDGKDFAPFLTKCALD